MADEPQFTIRDKRRHHQPPEPSTSTDAVTPPPSPRSQEGPTPPPERFPPASFTDLLMGLFTSARIALGLDPTQAPTVVATGAAAQAPSSSRPLDIEQARHLIDLLGLLEQKTAGHLTPDEQQLLQQLLYTLRLEFVECTRSGGHPTPGGAT